MRKPKEKEIEVQSLHWKYTKLYFRLDVQLYVIVWEQDEDCEKGTDKLMFVKFVTHPNSI